MPRLRLILTSCTEDTTAMDSATATATDTPTHTDTTARGRLRLSPLLLLPLLATPTLPTPMLPLPLSPPPSCHNIFCERNHVLKLLPTHPLTDCHKIYSFFLMASHSIFVDLFGRPSI